MAVVDSPDDLINKRLDLLWSEFLLVFAQIFLEVVLDVLENEIEAVVRINDFLEFDNVWVLEPLEKGNLSDSS